MQFYRNKLPKLDDYVMVKITNHDSEIGIHCELIEYNNIPAVIMNTEISKYKINYAKKFPIGKIIPCIVYMIDDTRGHINLSYKKITDELSLKLENIYFDKYHIYKLFMDINNFCDNKDFVNDMLWNCFNFIEDSEDVESYKTYYNKILDNCNLIFNFDYNKNFSKDKQDEIINNFESRIKKTDVVIEQQFNLTLLENNFIEKINKIFYDIDLEKKIKLVCNSSPNYSLIVTAENINEAKNIINMFFEKLKNNLSNYKYLLTCDTNDFKIIKDRILSISYLKPL